jgi:hypothetical protein
MTTTGSPKPSGGPVTARRAAAASRASSVVATERRNPLARGARSGTVVSRSGVVERPVEPIVQSSEPPPGPLAADPAGGAIRAHLEPGTNVAPSRRESDRGAERAASAAGSDFSLIEGASIMISKKLRALIAVAGIAVFVLISAAEAHAASWSVRFKIDFMDTDHVGGGYTIVPLAGSVANNSQNDPANCVSGTAPIDRFYLLAANLDQPGKDVVARTLLAAYLAGKPVSLNVSSVTCVSGRPAYGNVAIAGSL